VLYFCLEDKEGEGSCIEADGRPRTFDPGKYT
jgi:hypothetical protein